MSGMQIGKLPLFLLKMVITEEWRGLVLSSLYSLQLVIPVQSEWKDVLLWFSTIFSTLKWVSAPVSIWSSNYKTYTTSTGLYDKHDVPFRWCSLLLCKGCRSSLPVCHIPYLDIFQVFHISALQQKQWGNWSLLEDILGEGWRLFHLTSDSIPAHTKMITCISENNLPHARNTWVLQVFVL